MTNSKDTAKGIKHTPGPWKAIEWSCHAPTTVVSDFRVGRIIVAECSGQGRHSNESIADARLIAAAPEMLEALEHVYNHLIGLHAYLLSCETSVIVDNLETTSATAYKHAELAEAAIRKAKGEEISAVIKKGRNL